jgi:osmoprotectant transport system permease protein
MLDPAILAPLAQFVRDANDPNTSCVAENDTVCIGWAIDNFDRYVTPFLEHLVLVTLSVVFGFLIAFALGLISHRRRWLVPALTATTGILYTLPSIALFSLLLPITGRGTVTAIIALTLYNIQIIYRNIVAGLNNVPVGPKDAGRGMGMTARQMLWKVEFPLAVPEIVAGLRIATVSTVAIATLADLAGGGGLGSQIITGSNITFKTNIVVVTVLAVGMAVIFDVIFLLVQRRLTRWQTAGETKQSRSRRFDAAMARSRAA